MRDIQLSLNQTQKIRLQTSLDKLQSLSSNSNSNASVTVADSIPVNYEDGVLKGHGTSELEGQVIATVCGVVERVNKLVYVRSLRSRYKPETGDIIVGRVIEVSQKRWRVEINSNQDAVLMLSSVTLPDGIQRRRTPVDELNMRNIFEENDVISAEVRNLQHDGTWQLHARSDKYGKLDRGQLINVPSYLVKRRKQHFHQLDQYGVLLILGCNGCVWVGELIEPKDSNEADDEKDSEKINADSSLEVLEQGYTALETRQNICRIANAIRVLSTLGFNITIEVILQIVNLSTSMNLDINDMLGAEFCVTVAEKEVDRRSTAKKRKDGQILVDFASHLPRSGDGYDRDDKWVNFGGFRITFVLVGAGMDMTLTGIILFFTATTSSDLHPTISSTRGNNQQNSPTTPPPPKAPISYQLRATTNNTKTNAATSRSDPKHLRLANSGGYRGTSQTGNNKVQANLPF